MKKIGSAGIFIVFLLAVGLTLLASFIYLKVAKKKLCNKEENFLKGAVIDEGCNSISINLVNKTTQGLMLGVGNNISLYDNTVILPGAYHMYDATGKEDSTGFAQCGLSAGGVPIGKIDVHQNNCVLAAGDITVNSEIFSNAQPHFALTVSQVKGRFCSVFESCSSSGGVVTILVTEK